MNNTVSYSSQNIEIKNNSCKEKRVPSYISYPTAVAAGTIFGYTSATIAKNAVVRDASKLAQHITPSILDKTLDLPEIQKLGIKLNDVKWECFTNDIVKGLKSESKNIRTKAIPTKVAHKVKKFAINMYRKNILEIPSGKNANYLDALKTINLSKQKGGAFLFHELGHAKNFNSNNRLMKFLVKMRSPLISSAIMTAGLICAFIPEAEGKEANTLWGKTKNFFRECSVGITAVGALATPLEECIASIKGAKIARKILPKDQVKALNKMNSKAFLSYLAVAAGTILTTYLIKKITEKNKNTPDEVTDNCKKQNKSLEKIG